MALLALIPARAGSKGLARKNVLPLGDKPLIAWTIGAALQSEAFDRVVVSTDGEEIADVARNAGAEVPFVRPAELSGDAATTLAVAQHALSYFDAAGEKFDRVVILQPTSPFRNAEDINAAVEASAGGALISVCEVEHPIQWSLALDSDGKIQSHPDIRASESKRRQEMAKAWRPNGAIYIWPRAYIEADHGGMPEGCGAYVMPAERSIDIDSEHDLKVAKALLAL